jgi:predicted nucleic acid-binding protein
MKEMTVVADRQRVGLTAIASDDTDFDRVATLTRHWVINPPAKT